MENSEIELYNYIQKIFGKDENAVGQNRYILFNK
jgi:hypothetical protein